MDNYPFSKVDLRRNAGALAVRLSSMNSFVEASQELLSTTRNMSGSERQRHSKKASLLMKTIFWVLNLFIIDNCAD